MSLGSLLRRLRGSIRSASFEDGMEAELRHHVELETEALVGRGMDAAEARAVARRRFGSVAQVKDECRESWGLRAVDAIAQDLRYAVRTLRKYPGYTAVVLLTLGLGIGANTAIFSVVRAVLLRPLPYEHGDRLVEIRQEEPRIGVENAGVSAREVADYRAQTPSLDTVVEYHEMSFNLLGRGEASRVQTGVVSPAFFDALGVTPILGRTFREEDDAPGAPAVVILGYRYWKNSLGGDPAIVGRVFVMNDRPHTVVGVLPPVPLFPNKPGQLENDVYMPPSACPFRSNPSTVANRRGRMLQAFGRLRADATLETLQRDLDVVTGRFEARYGAVYEAARTGFRAAALSVREELTRRARPTLLILLATTAFVLLALARAIDRDRELALRSALGAGRGRIARQLLTESTLLAVAGGAAGLLCGYLVRDLLVAFTSRFTPRAEEIAIDGGVLGFTFAVSLCAGIVFGLLPAFAGRPRPHRRLGARSALIAAQVAISLVLLVGAGLLVRSFIKLQRVDAGFDTDRVLTTRVDLDFVKYATPESRRRFFRTVLGTVSAEPGLEAAALGISVPLDQAAPFQAGFVVEGQPATDRHAPARAGFKFASPGYFRTLGVQILSGRAFAESDVAQAPEVAIVNLSMARHHFPGVDPVGKRVSIDNGRTWMTIVGLANDTRDYGLATMPTDEVYLAFAQTSPLGATLMVRAAGDTAPFARRLPELIHEIDGRQPVSRIQTLDAVRTRSLSPQRLTALLVTLFAAVALVITSAGIAGVVSFSVNHRRTEIGVRMALGARPSAVVGLIIRQGLTPVLLGLALGLAGALAMTRMLGQLLFAIEPTDPPTYVAVLLTLAAVGALSCLTPACKAAGIDPMRALRTE